MLLVGVIAPLVLSSCLLDDGPDCGADFASCSGDFIEECSGGHESSTDCRAVCGSTCGYDESGRPICLCGP